MTEDFEQAWARFKKAADARKIDGSEHIEKTSAANKLDVIASQGQQIAVTVEELSNALMPKLVDDTGAQPAPMPGMDMGMGGMPDMTAGAGVEGMPQEGAMPGEEQLQPGVQKASGSMVDKVTKDPLLEDDMEDAEAAAEEVDSDVEQAAKDVEEFEAEATDAAEEPATDLVPEGEPVEADAPIGEETAPAASWTDRALDAFQSINDVLADGAKEAIDNGRPGDVEKFTACMNAFIDTFEMYMAPLGAIFQGADDGIAKSDGAAIAGDSGLTNPVYGKKTEPAMNELQKSDSKGGPEPIDEISGVESHPKAGKGEEPIEELGEADKHPEGQKGEEPIDDIHGVKKAGESSCEPEGEAAVTEYQEGVTKSFGSSEAPRQETGDMPGQTQPEGVAKNVKTFQEMLLEMSVQKGSRFGVRQQQDVKPGDLEAITGNGVQKSVVRMGRGVNPRDVTAQYEAEYRSLWGNN